MPPKTNQQRIKDLEVRMDEYNIAFEGYQGEYNAAFDKYQSQVFKDLDDIRGIVSELKAEISHLDLGEAEENMSLDDRFANHRDIILKLKDRFDEHVDEPDAHNPAFLARQSKSERKRIAAQVAAMRKAKDED